jgi:division protein CdvB (Snf7/Vps24/ESCRT-III family)
MIVIDLLIIVLVFHFYDKEVDEKCSGVTPENYVELKKQGYKIDVLCGLS